MADIIEITSSPEASPRPLFSKRVPLFLPDEGMEVEVIELTSSESEAPRKRRKTSSQAEQVRAGSSNVSNTQAYKPARRPAEQSSNSSASKRTPHREHNTPPKPPMSHQPHSPVLTPPTLSHSLDPSAPVEPQQPEDPIEHCVAQAREVFSDVCPTYVRDLARRYEMAFKNNLADAVMHMLLENPAYPKNNNKGKAREVSLQSNVAKEDGLVDYARSDREKKGGLFYGELTREQLYVDFPEIPEVHVNIMLAVNNNLYAPTHLCLLKERQSGSGKLPYVPQDPAARTRRVNAKKKGKRKAALHDAEFAQERIWLLTKLARDALEIVKGPADVENAQAPAEVENAQAPAEASTSAQVFEDDVADGIECGCCFTEYPFNKMIQCPDTHLFCSECVIAYASTKLGEHNPDLTCMDLSGCKLPFPDSELRRILPVKLLELFERVRQRRDVEAAGLEGLEECPFCDYKAVIDVDIETDKIFRCQNEECGKFSCRKCKKEDHLPKSCEEVEDDKKLDGKHAIEEAMTRALMRNCPQCKKAFIKESGCNKMTCPHCRTLSCYVCRKIVHGYDHFHQNVPGSSTGLSSNLCPLWDAVEQRHSDEVTAAAKRALEEYRIAHPDVDEKDIKVDLPPPPPPVPAGHLPLPRPAPAAHFPAAHLLAMHYDVRLHAHRVGVVIPPAPHLALAEQQAQPQVAANAQPMYAGIQHQYAQRRAELEKQRRQMQVEMQRQVEREHQVVLERQRITQAERLRAHMERQRMLLERRQAAAAFARQQAALLRVAGPPPAAFPAAPPQAARATTRKRKR
ncbi:hypothetical protein EW146_g7819 [Bondarzewia mesenterica]|uniref:RING-type domain-containing protein n=1 Tax=Bondarzewia mesenterica TaxID=1095465 RepID=A0A4S4LL35_9AGAM|nr:hypothetical protein EW146_g7819 [Bondarzewia mesenterica]